MAQTIIGSEFIKKVVPLIDIANESIDIIVFDWRWYANDISNPVQIFNQAIVRAHKRGVKVRVITNIDDVIKTLKLLGIACKKPITERLVHPKLMIIDHKVTIIGSHNYTQSAFTTNFEVSVILDDAEIVPSMLEFFSNLYTYGKS